MIIQRYTKRLALFFLAVVLFGSSLLGTATKANAEEANLALEVRSAILVEASTGKILYKHNENEALPPASMTKIMAEYLILEAIESKKITWDEKVPVSEYAFYIARKSDSAGVYLNMGEEFTVLELYKAMAIASANDATVLLAEKVGGSEQNFVSMMNKKAAELGMKQTHFATSSGLPANELGPYTPPNPENDNVMSARDAAILASALIRDFPEALEYSKIPHLVFREGKPNELRKPNYNWMLPGLISAFPGVDGLKTGYTKEAKHCFTGTATRDGMRLISVVMGADGELKRFEETKKLLNYGFSNYKLIKKIGKDAAIKEYEHAPVKKGVELQVQAVTENEVTVLAKVGEEDALQPSVVFHEELTAPLKKGDVIGSVVFRKNGETEEDYLQSDDFQKAGVNLVAAQDVEKASWIRLLFRSIIQFISDLFNSIVGK